MLTPQPSKFRGARAYANVNANALTFSGAILRPPAGGAVLQRIGTGVGGGGGVCFIGPESALPAFTPGLAVASLNTYPFWGSDYAPAGVVVAGQFAAVPTEGWSFATVYGIGAWDLFAPNVAVLFNTAAATAQACSFEWREFLSAEELQRWGSSRQL